jgi:putative transposase
MPERGAFGVGESCHHHSPKLGGENEEIAALLIGLTNARKTWGGSGCAFSYLHNVQGRRWNHKRVCRITRELELNLRIKPRKRLNRAKPDALAVANAPNLVQSIVAGRRCKASPRRDFMADRLGRSRRMKPCACRAADGPAFRLLNVLERRPAACAQQTPRGTSTARGWASKWISRCRLSGSSTAMP